VPGLFDITGGFFEFGTYYSCLATNHGRAIRLLLISQILYASCQNHVWSAVRFSIPSLISQRKTANKDSVHSVPLCLCASSSLLYLNNLVVLIRLNLLHARVLSHVRHHLRLTLALTLLIPHQHLHQAVAGLPDTLVVDTRVRLANDGIHLDLAHEVPALASGRQQGQRLDVRLHNSRVRVTALVGRQELQVGQHGEGLVDVVLLVARDGQQHVGQDVDARVGQEGGVGGDVEGGVLDGAGTSDLCSVKTLILPSGTTPS